MMDWRLELLIYQGGPKILEWHWEINKKWGIVILFYFLQWYAEYIHVSKVTFARQCWSCNKYIKYPATSLSSGQLISSLKNVKIESWAPQLLNVMTWIQRAVRHLPSMHCTSTVSQPQPLHSLTTLWKVLIRKRKMGVRMKNATLRFTGLRLPLQIDERDAA